MTLGVLPLTTAPRWVRPGEEKISGGKIQNLGGFFHGKFQTPLAHAVGCVGESAGVTRLKPGEFEHFHGQTAINAMLGVRVTLARSPGGRMDRDVRRLPLGALLLRIMTVVID